MRRVRISLAVSDEGGWSRNIDLKSQVRKERVRWERRGDVQSLFDPRCGYSSPAFSWNDIVVPWEDEFAD